MDKEYIFLESISVVCQVTFTPHLHNKLTFLGVKYMFASNSCHILVFDILCNFSVGYFKSSPFWVLGISVARQLSSEVLINCQTVAYLKESKKVSSVNSRRFGNNPFISRMFQPLGQNKTFTAHARQMMHMLFETCALARS